MKKILIALLVLSMLLACASSLAACDSSKDSKKDKADGTKATTSQTPPSGDPEAGSGNETQAGGDVDDNPVAPEGNDLSKLDVTYASVFSEGKAFIRNAKEYGRLHCIDQTGKILFTVNHTNKDGYLYVVEGFRDGVAALNPNQMYAGAWLCDEKGNLIEASAIGASAILIEETNEDSRELFRAGYFFAKKTTTDFSGSVDKVALFNNKLEVILDFSTELAETYHHYLYGEIYQHYALDLNNGNYMDLRTGKVGKIDDLLKTIKLDHPSDAWIPSFSGGSWVGYYNRLTGEKVVDLEKYDTLDDCGNFEDGKAPLIFSVHDSVVGTKKFFTVLNESGSFEFDPVEIYAGYEVKHYYNGVYVLYSISGNDTHEFAVIDSKGNVKEMTLESVGNHFQISVKFVDDCIMFRDNGTVQYYNFKLERVL